ncbi:hypothetical protein [Streptomyces wuyuanensis]|uniref:hypothetical protein n=1 Tax=Streptomyces wuyuanensis TaxID=1196353 RepID=UPI00343AAA8B
MVTDTMAVQRPEGLIGIHTDMPQVVPPLVTRPADMAREETRGADHRSEFREPASP